MRFCRNVILRFDSHNEKEQVEILPFERLKSMGLANSMEKKTEDKKGTCSVHFRNEK